MKNMNCMRDVAIFTLCMFVTACSSSPKSMIEKHLELVKAGNLSAANQQYCSPSDTLKLHQLKSFQVTSTQNKIRDGKKYTEVTAKIETDQYRFKKVDKSGSSIPEKEILQQVTLEVWNSEDFYQGIFSRSQIL